MLQLHPQIGRILGLRIGFSQAFQAAKAPSTGFGLSQADGDQERGQWGRASHPCECFVEVFQFISGCFQLSELASRQLRSFLSLSLRQIVHNGLQQVQERMF